MKGKGYLIARIILGLIFFVLGLNKFLQFMPQPPMPGEAGAFMGALAQTGYFFPVLAASETISGALLLMGVYVPLALLILAPIVLQILLFHTFLAPGLGMMPGFIAAVCGLYLAWCHREQFKHVLRLQS